MKHIDTISNEIKKILEKYENVYDISYGANSNRISLEYGVSEKDREETYTIDIELKGVAYD